VLEPDPCLVSCVTIIDMCNKLGEEVSLPKTCWFSQVRAKDGNHYQSEKLRPIS
jgi:hypothetical protein